MEMKLHGFTAVVSFVFSVMPYGISAEALAYGEPTLAFTEGLCAGG
jgi:hypothetical protein